MTDSPNPGSLEAVARKLSSAQRQALRHFNRDENWHIAPGGFSSNAANRLADKGLVCRKGLTEGIGYRIADLGRAVAALLATPAQPEEPRDDR